MDRQVYEQKINDQRFLIETLKAVDGKRKADIERMATQIDEQNQENKRLKESAKADLKEIERLREVITQVCEEREQALKKP